ncbi:DNA-binding protein MNB1B-like [Zingiber officinale]|uniref:DNA-binding protein MNB1B-like n=1 Tax=Zingiber officinale TaxID=94328 RepID=UPI001C4B0185|nr:DNA-binding protein MNB1B-like [Zingiber officinale]
MVKKLEIGCDILIWLNLGLIGGSVLGSFRTVKERLLTIGLAALSLDLFVRPQSAFFIFMEEFRKTFKEKNPNNKSVTAVAKAGGDKWKSLTEEEKAPYVAKAAKLKADYTKTMTAYNKGQSGGGGGSRAAATDEEEEEEGEESDKSKSEVNDEDEDDEEEEDEEDDE